MSKYVIHACTQRMWYVNEFLVPSMQVQGIKDIDIRCDYDGVGNLESCMSIFRSMPADGDAGSWHMQDDVIICRNFRELTEENDSGIVCGFTDTASSKIGTVDAKNMWWSFPCIRIPDYIAHECGEWYYSFAKTYAKYYEWVYMKKCDDNMFRAFIERNHSDMMVVNLNPNLVDHVDWLIGGSMVNKYRGDVHIRSQYFKDGDLVKRLEERLKVKKNE